MTTTTKNIKLHSSRSKTLLDSNRDYI